MIPKVNFTIASVNEIIDVLMYFINSKEDVNNLESIFMKYPLLKNKLENAISGDKKDIVFKFFLNFETKNKRIFNQVKEDFQKEWDKINDSIMIALEEVNEIKWDDKYKEFTARITLNPICPRYLNKNMFDIYFGVHNDLMIKLVMHELSHFIFFEKWKSIFPDYNPDEFECPHLLWKLSEMMPYIVLNDTRIRSIYNHEPCVYGVWHKIEIKGKQILYLLQEIYSNRKSFEDFVRKSWDLILENKNIFNNTT